MAYYNYNPPGAPPLEDPRRYRPVSPSPTPGAPVPPAHQVPPGTGGTRAAPARVTDQAPGAGPQPYRPEGPMGTTGAGAPRPPSAAPVAGRITDMQYRGGPPMAGRPGSLLDTITARRGRPGPPTQAVPGSGPTPITTPPPTGPGPGAPAPPPVAPDANDFQSQVFTPGDDPRLTGAQGRTDAAMNAITSGDPYSTRAGTAEGRYRRMFGTGAVRGGPNVDANDPGRYLDEQDAAVAGLGGPSRTELAKQALADFDQQGERALAGRFRKVGQSAAKFGRLGMGDVNAELGSIQGDFERDRMQRENELARSVAEGDIGDRFRRVETTSGLRRGESGIASGLRDEARTERAYDTDVDIGNEDRAFSRARTATDFGGRDADRDIAGEYDELNASGQLEDRVFGQGQRNRDEFRGERDFQQNARERERQFRLQRARALMDAGGQVPSLESLLGAA